MSSSSLITVKADIFIVVGDCTGPLASGSVVTSSLRIGCLLAWTALKGLVLMSAGAAMNAPSGDVPGTSEFLTSLLASG